MKEAVAKNKKIPRKLEKKIRITVAGAGAIIAVLFILLGTGIVSAATVSGPFSVIAYNTGQNQVTVQVTPVNVSYATVPMQGEIVANGQVLVKQNFTGSTNLFAYVTSAYSVLLLDKATNSYVFSQVFQAPTSGGAAVLKYEQVAAAAAVVAVACLLAFDLGKKSTSRQKKGPVGKYPESEMDAEASAAEEISKVFLDVEPKILAEIRDRYPGVWEKISEYGSNLALAVMHANNWDPQDFLDVVTSTKKELLKITLDTGSGGAEAKEGGDSPGAA